MTARVRLLVPIVLVASSAAALTQGRAGAARTGAIVGRVIDASHQPVADVLVMPLWETSSRHGKTIHPFDVRGGSTTNANGEFRIEHLFAGSYYLAALPRNVPRGQPLPTNSDAHRFGYAITYYPWSRESAMRNLSMSATSRWPLVTSPWRRLTSRRSAGQRSHRTVNRPTEGILPSRMAITFSASIRSRYPFGPMARSESSASRPARTTYTCAKANGRRRAM